MLRHLSKALASRDKKRQDLEKSGCWWPSTPSPGTSPSVDGRVSTYLTVISRWVGEQSHPVCKTGRKGSTVTAPRTTTHSSPGPGPTPSPGVKPRGGKPELGGKGRLMWHSQDEQGGKSRDQKGSPGRQHVAKARLDCKCQVSLYPDLSQFPQPPCHSSVCPKTFCREVTPRQYACSRSTGLLSTCILLSVQNPPPHLH